MASGAPGSYAKGNSLDRILWAEGWYCCLLQIMEAGYGLTALFFEDIIKGH